MMVRSTIIPIAPDDDRRDDQHRDPDAEAKTIGFDGGVAAKHQKLAVRQVDDLHHPEDDRQPHAHQREAGDRIENLDRQERYEIHKRSCMPCLWSAIRT